MTALGVIVLAVQKRRGPELAHTLLGLTVVAALAAGASAGATGPAAALGNYLLGPLG